LSFTKFTSDFAAMLPAKNFVSSGRRQASANAVQLLSNTRQMLGRGKMFEWRRPRGGWVSQLKILGLALTLTLIVRTVVAEPYVVPTGSMVPTLLAGDRILASKYPYGFSTFSSPIGFMPNFGSRVLNAPPKRGDVVVFRLPSDTTITYVKRVIGLPGERIEMRRGQLYIDGKMVPRRFVGQVTTEVGGRVMSLRQYVETLPNGREHPILKISDNQPLDNTSEFVVPLRSYFVMGDNRDDSLDSRVPANAGGVGFVPEENLVGRVDLVLFSSDPDVASWDIPHWSGALRRSRLLTAVR
jgi:signal peptidase I